MIIREILALIVVVWLNFKQANGDFYQRPGLSAGEVLLARGYLAQDYNFPTPDGYKIRLTKGTNPLINNGASGLANRDPILFIHGILVDSGVFVLNSADLKGPQDLSKLSLNDSAAVESVSKMASSKALPFLAMDFGHEVWFMNRRGFPGSQDQVATTNLRSMLTPEFNRNSSNRHHCHRDDDDYGEYADFGDDDDDDYDEDDDEEHDHKDYIDRDDASNNRHGDGKMIVKSRGKLRFALTGFLELPSSFLLADGKLVEKTIYSFDSGFWAYSLDQEAKFDVPMAIGHILAISNRPKIATATHSAGGGLLLMALSLYPKLADKLAANVLWSPSFCFGKGDGFQKLLAAQSFLERFEGPIPPTWVSPPFQNYVNILCALPFAKKQLCQFYNDFMNGADPQQKPMYEQFASTQAYPTSTREMAQFLQTVARGGRMHFYDYGEKRNALIYGGNPEPPAYNLSDITSRTLSFYSAPKDQLITDHDIQVCRSLLKVASKHQAIQEPMDHVGFLLHADNAKLVNIPSLRDIHNMGGQV